MLRRPRVLLLLCVLRGFFAVALLLVVEQRHHRGVRALWVVWVQPRDMLCARVFPGLLQLAFFLWVDLYKRILLDLIR